MIITRISFKNFKNFKEQTIEFGEGMNVIARQNRWGKTTVADGISFAFVGKKYDGSSDVASFKNIQDTKATASVEMGLLLSNGRELSIRKDYYENWVKTRGTTESVMQGHITDCYIDGVFKPVSEFQKTICELFNVKDLEMVQVLTNPYYFSQVLDWKKRREIVNLVIGEVHPEDVFQANPGTKCINEDLKKAQYRIGDARNILKNVLQSTNGSGLKKEESDLQAQINGTVYEFQVSEEEFTNAARTVASNETRITELRAKKLGIVNPTLNNLKYELSQAQTNLNKSVALDNAKVANDNAAYIEKIETERRVQAANRKVKEDKVREQNKIINQVDANRSLILQKIATLSDLGARYKEKKAETFAQPETVQCPQCGFALNGEDIEKAKAEWNLKRSESLSKLIKDGNALKSEIQTLQIQTAELDAKVEKLEIEIKALDDQILASEKRIDDLKTNMRYQAEDSEETKNIRQRIEKLNADILAESSKTIATAEIDALIEEIKKESEKANDVLTHYRTNQYLQHQKLEREKKLADVQLAIAEVEQKLIAIDEYTKTFLRLIGERVKSAFGDINIRLIENNIKAGSWNETCYVLDKDGVPYESMNTERKIKYGLKIIDVIVKKLGYEQPPVVIDNCEAITSNNRHFDFSGQTVSLVASDIDQTISIQGEGLIPKEEAKIA